MVALFITRWLGYITLFFFATICLATGLYYLAEIVEEYEKVTRKVIKYAVFGVLGLHVLLWILEGFPFLPILVGLASHGLYFQLLRQFPKIQLTNAVFLLSIVALVLNHILWFRYFTEIYYPFEDICMFFLLCVWLVPFSFFISMTSTDSSLPYGSTLSATGEPVSYDSDGRKANNNLVLRCFKFLKRKQEELVPMDILQGSRSSYKTF